MTKKKIIILLATTSTLVLSSGAVLLTKGLANQGLVIANSDTNYWNHYARIEPTALRHGSKEFWANCSTHDFTLNYPGIGEDIREGVAFDTTPYFDDLDSSDPRYIAPVGIDVKGYFNSLLEAFTHDPYSFIPESMRPEGTQKYTESSVTYDFTNFTDVSSIKYGGYGEQWHMVIENIKESERFYKITTYGSEVLAATNLVATSFLNGQHGESFSETFTNGTTYTFKLSFNGSILKYNVKYLTNVNVPLFGDIIPQVDMEYEIETHTKTVRIQLGENNALKFVITLDSYTFGLEYGITQVSRKAYFTISHDEDSNTSEGHIYEFVQFKDKDLVPSCADFYIGETYTSAVGNKASGLVGFNNYINELYKTNEGKLLGYEIQETKSSITFNTLWFNLNNITGLTNVKHADDKFYVNNSDVEFKTKNYGGVNAKTASRRFDIEERLQYFFGLDANEDIVEYETSIPMMFVQEEKLSDFASDVTEKNSYLNVSINLSDIYLTKIQTDYVNLIPEFIINKDNMDSAAIVTYIGEAAVVS